MLNNAIVKNDLWQALQPALTSIVTKNVIGITPYGKTMLLMLIKNDLTSMPDEFLLDKNIEGYAVSVRDKWIDNKNCNDCLHSKVCGKIAVINQTIELGIQCRRGCDDYLGKEAGK